MRTPALSKYRALMSGFYSNPVSFVKMFYKLLLIFSKEFTRLRQSYEDYPPVEAMVFGPGTRIGLMASGPDFLPCRRSSSAVTWVWCQRAAATSEWHHPGQGEARSLAPAFLPELRAHKAGGCGTHCSVSLWQAVGRWGDPIVGYQRDPRTMHLFPHLGSASTGE